MKLAGRCDTLSGRGIAFASEFEPARKSVTWGYFDKTRHRDAWNNAIDTLIEWGRDPSSLEDDGIDAPTGRAVSRACQIAKDLQSLDFPAPTRVVPTGNGGVALQLERNDSLVSFEVDAEANVEFLAFEGCHLLIRHPFQLAD